jgi:hypothetical protein
MKELRPDRYSDSVIVKRTSLDRAILDFHLHTLTTRNQERDFETFAVRLAQLEITPNLRVQTGPVGGGDAKADSETYPISELLGGSYYDSEGNSTEERWAFAISAKQEWRTKVKADVNSIISTNRGYNNIFFISNQAIKDKARAEVEDELLQNKGIRLTILDRNWILDRVFNNKRENLAVELLRMGDGLTEQVQLGPNDYERKQQYDQLADEIDQIISKGVINGDLVHKAISFAYLSAGLEVAAPQVLANFDRAITFAKKGGTEDNIFAALYAKAWTSIFHLERYDIFLPLYDKIEELAIKDCTIHRAECLLNLYMVMKATPSEVYRIDPSTVQDKELALLKMLKDIADDEEKPSASLHSTTLMAFLQLQVSENSDAENGGFIKQLHFVIESCDGLIGFPWDETVEMIEMLGTRLGEFLEFEQLMDVIFEKTERRKGEIPKAQSQFKFGKQHYEADRPYKAIQFIGRALPGLYKRESRDDFYYASGILSQCYIQIDMYWAARGVLLNGASPLIIDMEKAGTIPNRLLEYYERLRLVEMMLGRLSPALRFHRLYLLILSNISDLSDERKQQIAHSHENFELYVMTTILKIPLKDITLLELFPDKLMELQLNASGAALLYLLGGKMYMPDVTELEEELKENYSSFLPAPADWEFPELPKLYQESRVVMDTTILGGDIMLDCDNNLTSILLAESIIAGLEAMMPTFIQQKLLPKNELFTIVIDALPQSADGIIIETLSSEHNRVTLNNNQFEPYSLTKEQQASIKVKINDILILIFGTNYFVTPDLVQSPDVWDALSRALNFSGSFLMLGNVAFHAPMHQPQNWDLSNCIRYPYVPADVPRIIINKSTSVLKDKDSNKSTRDSINEDTVGQRDVSFSTVVNADLWAAAGMQGVAFGLYPGPKGILVPFIAPLFTNADGGRKIFSEWKSRFAEKISEKISLYIVKGINRDNLGWYSVTFVPKELAHPGRELKFVMTAGHVSTSNSTANLDAFIENYKKTGYCILLPCFYGPGMTQPLLYHDLEFTFSNVIVTDAWKIAPYDSAVYGLRRELTPYIPPGVKNAPILETLALMKSTKDKK